MAEEMRRITIRLFNSEINIIKQHKEANKFSNDTEALRNILNTFDPKKELRKNKLVFLIYPGLLPIILFIFSQTMYTVYESTRIEGIPFQVLFDMGQISMIIGFGALFWFFINLFMYRDKVLGKKLEKL